MNPEIYGWLYRHEPLGITFGYHLRQMLPTFRDYLDGRGWKSNGTDLEVVTALALLAYGITPPLVQQQTTIIAAGNRYRADFALPELHVVIEADGPLHARTTAVEYDCQRTEHLNADGWTVYRVDCTDRDYTTVGPQVAGIAAHLAGHWPDAPARYVHSDELALETQIAATNALWEANFGATE